MTPTTGQTSTSPNVFATRFFCGFSHTGLWLIDTSGSTSSFNTGPPFGQGGWFDNYAHIETSFANPNGSLLTSPPLALPVGGTFSFYYYMYGATIGTLTVQTCTGMGVTMACANVWTRSGPQQATQYFSTWLQATIQIPPNTQYIRFNATRGRSFTGDIAIDTLRLVSPSTTAPTAAPTFVPTSAPASGGGSSASSGSSSSDSGSFVIYFIIVVVLVVILLGVIVYMAARRRGGGGGNSKAAARTFDNPL